MKQLTQAVFEGQCRSIKSAATDKNGDTWFYQVSSNQLYTNEIEGGHEDNSVFAVTFVGSEFDTSDWKNSAMDREFN